MAEEETGRGVGDLAGKKKKSVADTSKRSFGLSLVEGERGNEAAVAKTGWKRNGGSLRKKKVHYLFRKRARSRKEEGKTGRGGRARKGRKTEGKLFLTHRGTASI